MNVFNLWNPRVLIDFTYDEAKKLLTVTDQEFDLSTDGFGLIGVEFLHETTFTQ